MPLTPGARLGPYEIVSLVGTGGMGEVYRARDPKLNRFIAIKVLPEATAADPDRRARFEREAQSLAALSHPNIVTIHSVEEADGVLFLTMEYVDGRPLSDLTVKGGLSLTQILNLAIPLADGVSAAHQQGITHRDLKPSNVIVSRDGRVKIVDFGLAKLLEAPPVEGHLTRTAPLTGEGRIVGTVAYMSPEQAEGKSLDHRSDIFSLGVMLYEMATSERPFTGGTSVAVLSSLVKDTPRPVTDLRPALPRDLSRIIKRCLVKDPEHRYQTAKDVRNELEDLKQETESSEGHPSRASRADTVAPIRPATPWKAPLFIATGALVVLAIGLVVWRLWVTPSATSTAIDSLAVLPFVNVGGDPNTEYLSDGITENLINSLSQIPQLRVVPRGHVFRYKGRESDAEQIGRELKVRAVLTGKVVQRGDNLNIQTELVDVGADSQLWGQQFNRTLSQIIAVQEEIATAVSDKLRLRPTGEEQKRLARGYPENPEAHQLYLKGRYLWNRRTGDTLTRAVDYFQQAIDKDPAYGLAWAGLADCYAVYGFYDVLPPRETVPKAKEAANRAVALDETLAEPHATLGYIKNRYDWDWAGADQEFRRAIALNPTYATAHYWYANFLSGMGRSDEAIAEARRAQEADPLSLVAGAVTGQSLYCARHYDQAAEVLRKTLEIDHNFSLAHQWLALVDGQVGRHDDAISEAQQAVSLSARATVALGVLGHEYAVSGKRAEAEKVLSELQGLRARRYVSPLNIAMVYAGLGDNSQALDWLERAYEDRSDRVAWINVWPPFDGLRAEPRLQDLLRRMNLLK